MLQGLGIPSTMIYYQFLPLEFHPAALGLRTVPAVASFSMTSPGKLIIEIITNWWSYLVRLNTLIQTLPYEVITCLSGISVSFS